MVGTRTSDKTTNTRGRRRRLWPWLTVLILVLALGGGGLVWFFTAEAPAAVDLSATAAAVAGQSDEAASPTTGGIEGPWTVDTTVGEFTVDGETTATFAGFRVDEVLNSIGATTAVGRTPAVTGTIEIEGTSLTSAEITVDLTAIISDQSRREDAIQRALGTSTNPNATFVLTEPIELGSAAADGQAISTTATGDLTINGVTRNVDIALEAQLIDGEILVTGSTGITFSDYGVSAPTAPVVLSVEDNGIVEFQVWLSR